MELVPIVYKSALLAGGLNLIVLIELLLASRKQKKKNEVCISSIQDNSNEKQIANAHLKYQLQVNKSGNEHGTAYSRDPEKDHIMFESKSEKPSEPGEYSQKSNTSESSPLFPIVNEKIKLNKYSKNISEIENEFRFFYRQNYSNTV